MRNPGGEFVWFVEKEREVEDKESWDSWLGGNPMY